MALVGSKVPSAEELQPAVAADAQTVPVVDKSSCVPNNVGLLSTYEMLGETR